MGYYAYVNCNCFQEGRTTEPPYPEYVRINDQGFYLDTELLSSKKARMISSAFGEWRRSACEHLNMTVLFTSVSNMSDMQRFFRMLYQLGGKDKFPILSKYLPLSVDPMQTLPAKFAQRALTELDVIMNCEVLEDTLILRKKNSCENCALTNDLYHSLELTWTIDCEYKYYIDKNGFFIVEAISNEEVFRSMNFIQEEISSDEKYYRFIDSITGKSFDCSMKVDRSSDNLVEFEIIIESGKASENYKYIIHSLRKALKASIMTGNPVIWH